ncbi:MAG: hypothetical protein GY870_16630, partial [archaeon]|nr:hypothetical protein [archaeon]
IAVSDSLSILKDTIEGKIQGYTADKDIEKLAFALEGLDTIGGISGLGTENTNNIHILLNSFKETHGSNIGFRMSENENVTVTGTYYALKCFYHLDHTMSNITSNLTSINSYVLSCYNSTVGGFISNTTDLSAPNLLNTYFSVQIYNYTNQIGSLTAAVISKIDNYIDSFYISNVNDEDNLGGYIDSSDSSKATFSATYHSVLTLNTLNSNVKPSENTVNWILEHQNPIDGGFSSIKASEGLESISSCIISYYAVKIISLSENGLLWLDEQAWGLFVDWLLVLGISLLIVAIAIAIILGYKRRIAI